MANRLIYPKIGPVIKFAASMSGIASTFAAISYYQRRNNKINLIVGLDGPLVCIVSIKTVGKTGGRPSPHNRSEVVNSEFQITSEILNKKYDVWVRPYASFMFFVLQSFCNFYMYTSMSQDIADKVLDNVNWSNKFIEKRYGDKIYEENHCSNVILLITSSSELFQNQNNINDPYQFMQIPRYNDNSYDNQLVRTGRIIYRFFN